MNKTLYFLIFACLPFALKAQVQAPQPSPSTSVKQVVGMTEFNLEYARPAARGRTVFGNLVPLDKKWRTGANANTKISFSDDIVFGGSEVKAGEYAIFSKPKANEWKVFLYAKTDNWGLPQEWDMEKVVATAIVPVSKVSHVENFEIRFANLTNSSAHLVIAWEETQVAIPIEVPTDKKVLASIEKTMAGEPTARDYYSAATYYFSEGKDMQQAKEWIDMAMKMQEQKPFWMLRQQSLIYAAAGDKKAAIKIAKESLEASKKAGNDDYVKMNTDSLKEWGAKI